MRPSAERSSQLRWRQVLLSFLLSLFRGALPDQIRYSVPEELAKNSVVGNLAKDLGLSVRDLPARKLRVSAEKEYFTVNPESGDLLVSDRIDREQICGMKPLCILDFDTVAENPLNIFRVAVTVQDINDNIPLFKQRKIDLKIGESTKPGRTFPLDPALDLDAGSNSLQRYHLSDNEYFDLAEKQAPDGRKYPELILKHSLDREEQNFHQLVLTAVDGGDPPQSGTTQIQIQVIDANDNPPVFSQDVYRVSLQEGVPRGFSVLRVTATDQDEGVNAEVTYSFHNVDEQVEQFFTLDKRTGEITTKNDFDFEIASSYTLGIEAKDPGELAAHCSIQVEILDENDCAPEVIVTSVFTPLPEDSPPGTVIALIKTRDRDSGENGDVYCRVLGKTEFLLKSYSKDYYKLVTDRALDREEIPEYNVTILATDRGKPPLSSSTTITLHITDVNDNAELQFYLVVALALISVLFLLAVILAVALRLRSSSSPASWSCFQPGLSSKPGPGVLPNYSEGTLPYSYNLCVASQSAKTEFNFLNVTPEVTPPQDLLCEDACWVPSTNHGDGDGPLASDTILKVSFNLINLFAL
ncbi:PREDICTED: protocadherin gamma-B2-like [Hipposideros armiger]|uniref:Protocadherin gamma-B2-like n=1 Tax=Hipposideros armiger TaxID=186990 RepID=A0A8B7SX91_HIPAR|nr:PREDICTED: protocadherin gamma-B2-like [Hipposideros armiger]